MRALTLIQDSICWSVPSFFSSPLAMRLMASLTVTYLRRAIALNIFFSPFTPQTHHMSHAAIFYMLQTKLHMQPYFACCRQNCTCRHILHVADKIAHAGIFCMLQTKLHMQPYFACCRQNCTCSHILHVADKIDWFSSGI